MNSCAECTVETKNPKFCTRSCSVKYNNKKSPKRRLEGACAACGTSVSSSRKYCGTCRPEGRTEGNMVDPRQNKRNTKDIGDRCELEIAFRLMSEDLMVLRPTLGENHRYDLVVEEEGRFFRVQCKSGRLINGAVVFGTTSSHYHRGGKARGYRGEVELFGVYCPGTSEIYFVSPMAVTLSLGSLRVEAPKNSIVKGVRWAADFKWQPGTTLASLEAKR